MEQNLEDTEHWRKRNQSGMGFLVKPGKHVQSFKQKPRSVVGNLKKKIVIFSLLSVLMENKICDH